MQQLAESRGGKCLSEEYINNTTKLSWECREGHVWKTTPHTVKEGYWCPTCRHDKSKKTIEQMQELAKNRGGKCLSKEYIHSTIKLTWQCKEGHTWETSPKNIQQGKWCPHCHKLGIKKTTNK